MLTPPLHLRLFSLKVNLTLLAIHLLLCPLCCVIFSVSKSNLCPLHFAFMKSLCCLDYFLWSEVDCCSWEVQPVDSLHWEDLQFFCSIFFTKPNFSRSMFKTISLQTFCMIACFQSQQSLLPWVFQRNGPLKLSSTFALLLFWIFLDQVTLLVDTCIDQKNCHSKLSCQSHLHIGILQHDVLDASVVKRMISYDCFSSYWCKKILAITLIEPEISFSSPAWTVNFSGE